MFGLKSKSAGMGSPMNMSRSKGMMGRGRNFMGSMMNRPRPMQSNRPSLAGPSVGFNPQPQQTSSMGQVMGRGMQNTGISGGGFMPGMPTQMPAQQMPQQMPQGPIMSGNTGITGGMNIPNNAVPNGNIGAGPTNDLMQRLLQNRNPMF